MLSTFIKTTRRNVSRNKVYALINFVGLASGITLSLLVFIYLREEVNYDTFHKDADRTRDISKVKVISAAGPLLQFRLPECFEFLLSHEERHLAQIKEILMS